MNIYTTLDLQINNLLVIPTRFKSSRLYIKRILRDNGVYIYYFGKSWKENLKSYTGSGVVWDSFVKKYGKDNVEHIWESHWYDDPLEIQHVAIRFSLENNIVESPTWANSKIENGLDGGLISSHSKKSISNKLFGIKRGPNSGTSGTMWINDGVTNTCIKKDQIIPMGWFSGRVTKDQFGKNNSVYGKIKCNNGIIIKYFDSEDQIPDGWFKGSLKKKIDTYGGNNSVHGKKKYNNGVIQKYFDEDADIPNGWNKGGLPRKKATL